MEETNASLIENVLKQDGQDIEFEPIPEEHDSPLSQPVVKKSNTAGDVNAAKQEARKQEAPEQTDQSQSPPTDTAQQTQERFDDAPEQEIDAERGEENQQSKGSENEEYSMPLEHAQLMADSIIGTVNNTLLEVGGGYFVRVSKHKEFYDFEEIIQVIDDQNTRNIKRLKLDEEDKALLRPLLVQIIRKKAAVLSPEKQLLMVLLSILIKKSKLVMEIREENDALVERIREIIRKEVRAAREDQPVEQKQERSAEPVRQTTADFAETIYEEEISGHGQSQTGLPAEVVEHY